VALADGTAAARTAFRGDKTACMLPAE
jgi:hypothetical protein